MNMATKQFKAFSGALGLCRLVDMYTIRPGQSSLFFFFPTQAVNLDPATEAQRADGTITCGRQAHEQVFEPIKRRCDKCRGSWLFLLKM